MIGRFFKFSNTRLNNALEVDNTHFYYDIKDGKHGFNTDPNRGADTFHPFHSGLSYLGYVSLTSNSSTIVSLSDYEGKDIYIFTEIYQVEI